MYYQFNGGEAKSCTEDTTVGRLTYDGKLIAGATPPVALKYNGSNHALLSPLGETGKILFTYYSTGTAWNYVGYYDNLARANLEEKFTWPDHTREFWFSRSPDVWFTDSTDQKLLINPNTIAFSQNGAWMVADTSSGLVRIDVATGGVLPFAPTLQQNNYSGLSSAQLAVTNDGYFAAISVTSQNSSHQPANLKLYDLRTCNGTVANRSASSADCANRDLWNGYHASHYTSQDRGIGPTFTSPANPVNLRFSDDYNLTFNLAYDVVGGSYDAASFVVTAPGASQFGIGLLGMGDSYISGEGTNNYFKNTNSTGNKCHQSKDSYPFLLGARYFESYNSVACSGAVTHDIDGAGSDDYKSQAGGISEVEGGENSVKQSFLPGYLPQVTFLGVHRPKAVLLSIGGNDVQFSSIVKRCVNPIPAMYIFQPPSETCYASYQERLRLMEEINSTFDSLYDTYRTVMQSAPGTRLYVVGYPQIVKADGDCGLNVRLGSTETKFAEHLIDYLDLVIQRAANKAGAFYVDTRAAFDGHKLCEAGAPAMNGITVGDDILVIGNESYHPTIYGYQLLSRAIDEATSGLSVPMPTAQLALSQPTINPNDPLLATAPIQNKTDISYPTKQISDAAPSIWQRASRVVVRLKGLFSNFASNTTIKAFIHSTPMYIGDLTTNANGDIEAGELNVPTDVEPGFHTLILQGKDLSGATVNVEQTIYVAASANDYDGDGVPNSEDSCGGVTNSGIDIDRDGIDDACDSSIQPVGPTAYEQSRHEDQAGDSYGSPTPTLATRAGHNTVAVASAEQGEASSLAHSRIETSGVLGDESPAARPIPAVHKSEHSYVVWAGFALVLLLAAGLVLRRKRA